MATISFKIDDESKAEFDHLVARLGLNASEIFRQSLRSKMDALRQKSTGLTLTKVERLMLYNQFQILLALQNSAYSSDDLSAKCEALTAGYTAHYDHLVDFFDHDVPRELSEEVIEILEMHRAMYNFYSDIGQNHYEESEFKFLGFDANEESSYYAYASYYVIDLDRYRELRNGERPSLNTHWPILDTYRKMVRHWKTIGEPRNLSRKNVDDLLSIKSPRRNG